MEWLWWLGNAGLVVALGVVGLLLHRLLEPVREIDRYVGDVREHSRGLGAGLREADDLSRTPMLIRRVRAASRRAPSRGSKSS